MTAALVVPVLQIVGCAIAVMLCLVNGSRRAAMATGVAGLLAGIVLAMNSSLDIVLSNLVAILVPSLLLGLLLRRTRSLVLTLQISAILAAVVVGAFGLVVTDPVAYWQPVLQSLIEFSRDNGLNLQADILSAEPEMAAQMITLAFVLVRWTLYVVAILLGYGLARKLAGAIGDYGRFSDLDFGRVLALCLAVASLAAFLLDSNWLQGFAVVLFATFGLQGLAIVHWLHGNGTLPGFFVAATYALMLVLHVFLLLALALLGYIDAWFAFRRRAVGHSKI